MIHYISNWYREANPARAAELAEAAERRARQTDRITVLSEVHDCPCPNTRFSGRPTFRDLMDQQRPDCVNVLVNADVVLDDVSVPKMERLSEGVVWCLSRRDNLYAASQDAWAWRGVLPLGIGAANYPQGIPGCDNRFAFDCAVSPGFQKGDTMMVLNPALDIALHHLHASGVRNYVAGDRLTYPYLFIKPAHLADKPLYEYRGDGMGKIRIRHLWPYLKELRA